MKTANCGARESKPTRKLVMKHFLGNETQIYSISSYLLSKIFEAVKRRNNFLSRKFLSSPVAVINARLSVVKVQELLLSC